MTDDQPKTRKGPHRGRITQPDPSNSDIEKLTAALDPDDDVYGLVLPPRREASAADEPAHDEPRYGH